MKSYAGSCLFVMPSVLPIAPGREKVGTKVSKFLRKSNGLRQGVIRSSRMRGTTYKIILKQLLSINLRKAIFARVYRRLGARNASVDEPKRANGRPRIAEIG